jgi:hypothetical protein
VLVNDLTPYIRAGGTDANCEATAHCHKKIRNADKGEKWISYVTQGCSRRFVPEWFLTHNHILNYGQYMTVGQITSSSLFENCQDKIKAM